nr:hypothetical protein [Paraburkholderia bannensis]
MNDIQNVRSFASAQSGWHQQRFAPARPSTHWRKTLCAITKIKWILDLDEANPAYHFEE